ncbi:MAG: CapA family protein [Oscillospiraceae bacterium]|nr:CapA family protein [Oscillospiraceae bacterium]
MLTLANNHCMDRGEQGILNTVDNCKRYGFDTIGIYKTEKDRNKAFIKELNGIKIAFINYTYGTNAFSHHRFLEHPYMVNLFQPEETKLGSIHLLNDYKQIADDLKRIYYDKSEEYDLVKPYLEQLEKDIKNAKESADYVIVIAHNGGQYVEPVDPYSIYIAEKIKEFGADIIVGHHQHIIQKSDISDDYTKIYCLGNFFYDNRIVGEDCYFDKPLYDVVFHLSLIKDEQGRVTSKQSFSIYTTMTDERGMPVVVNAADVYSIKPESHLRLDILRYANLFVGEERYKEVQERYEI